MVFVGTLGGMLALDVAVAGLGLGETAAELAPFVAQIGSALLACALLGHGALRASFANGARPLDLALAVVVGVAGFGVTLGWIAWLGSFTGFEATELEEPLTPLVILAAVVGAPLVEEWTDRGVLWRALEPLTSTAGLIVTSAMLFALMHGLNGGFVLELPHRFAVGLGFGWLRARSRSLLPGIIAHAVHNGIAVLV